MRALYDKALAFQKKGVRVAIYTFSTHDKDFLPFGNAFPTHAESLSFRGLRRFKNYFRATESVARKMDASDADLLLVEKCRIFGAPPLLRYLKRPSIFYTQEPLRIREYEKMAGDSQRVPPGFSVDSFPWKFLRSAGRLRSRFFVKAEDRKAILAASRVMANSYFTAEWIRRVYGVEARVVYQGVNTDFFCPEESKKSRSRVLSVGRIDRVKGHDFIIRALGLVPEAMRPELTVVCDFIDPAVLKDLGREAKKNSVQLSIRYRIPDDDLRRLYRDSVVTLCGAVHEPFGLVPLESMACGTPVIAVAEGGFRETVADGRTGHLLARDEGQWAKKIAFLMSNPEECRRMGLEGRSHALVNWRSDFFVSRFEKNLI